MPVFTALPSPCLGDPSECVFVNNQTAKTLTTTTFFPTVGVCCFSLEAQMRDKNYHKAQFITLRLEGRAIRKDAQTDEEVEGNSMV